MRIHWTAKTVAIATVVGVAVAVATWLGISFTDPAITLSLDRVASFSDSSGHIGIYRAAIISTGKREVSNIVARLVIPDAQLLRVSAVSTNPLVETQGVISGNSYIVRVSALNPGEDVQIGLLTTSRTSLPESPQAFIRANGATGKVYLTGEESSVTMWSILSVLVSLAVMFWAGYTWGKASKKASDGKRDVPARQHPPQSVPASHEQEITLRPIFGPNVPFPVVCGQAKLGMHISVIASMFPNNHSIESDWISLEFTSEPIASATYYFDKRKREPIANWCVIHWDQENESQVRDAALQAFGSSGLTTLSLGAVYEWDTVNGYKVELKRRQLAIAKAD